MVQWLTNSTRNHEVLHAFLYRISHGKFRYVLPPLKSNPSIVQSHDHVMYLFSELITALKKKKSDYSWWACRLAQSWREIRNKVENTYVLEEFPLWPSGNEPD